MIYVWPANDYLKAFSLRVTGFATTPAARSATLVQSGLPGGSLSLSAKGGEGGTAIVWASHQLTWDPTDFSASQGVLLAFDATNLANELWDSNQNAGRDGIARFSKFCPPTIANGKVYLGSSATTLSVYGLLANDGGTSDGGGGTGTRTHCGCRAGEGVVCISGSLLASLVARRRRRAAPLRTATRD
jgi:hypothetical protein